MVDWLLSLIRRWVSRLMLMDHDQVVMADGYTMDHSHSLILNSDGSRRGDVENPDAAPVP